MINEKGAMNAKIKQTVVSNVKRETNEVFSTKNFL